MDRPVEAQATFILAKDSYGLLRLLPAYGGNGAEAAGALLDKVSRFRRVFFA